MRKTTLLVFDRQLFTILGALKKLHSCFSIIFVQSLPSEKFQALMELKQEGWQIKNILYSHEKSFLKELKHYISQNRIQNVIILPPTETFQKRMHEQIRKALSIPVKEKFEQLALTACEHFERFMKKRIKKCNDLSFKMINGKFSLLVDEYGELLVEGLQDKPLNIPEQLNQLKMPEISELQKMKTSISKPFSFSKEEDK